jgi:hypothetical protein
MFLSTHSVHAVSAALSSMGINHWCGDQSINIMDTLTDYTKGRIRLMRDAIEHASVCIQVDRESSDDPVASSHSR